MSKFFESVPVAKRYATYRPKSHERFVDIIVAYDKEQRGIPDGAAYRGGLLLDAGCGSGQVAECFAPFFDSVIGFDTSKAQIETARQNSSHPNVNYVEGRGECMPADDNSVDLLTCGNAVHWMDVERFISECKRVLRPGGSAALFCEYFSCIAHGTHDESCDQFVKVNQESKIMMEFFDKISVGQRPFLLVMNKYRDVEELIDFERKRRVDFPLYRHMTLGTLKKFASTMSTYNSCLKTLEHEKNEVEDPLRVLNQKLTDLWNVGDSDEEDISITLKQDAFILLFTK